jgi:hypothetical protein
MTVWKVLRGLAGLESGRWCRCCSESITRSDEFGLSEGVCRPCRQPGPPGLHRLHGANRR